jgi:hypothetical protein
VANTEKEKDAWITKVSQAILDYNSIYIPPPPAQQNSPHSAGTHQSHSQKRNPSSGSVGSRTNSSSNIASEAGETLASVPDEEGEEGLLTFDDVPQSPTY